MGDIPIAALDIIAIPNEMKQVPVSNAKILFIIIILPFHNIKITQQTKGNTD
jgi:hypothetical protein